MTQYISENSEIANLKAKMEAENVLNHRDSEQICQKIPAYVVPHLCKFIKLPLFIEPQKVECAGHARSWTDCLFANIINDHGKHEDGCLPKDEAECKRKILFSIYLSFQSRFEELQKQNKWCNGKDSCNHVGLYDMKQQETFMNSKNKNEQQEQKSYIEDSDNDEITYNEDKSLEDETEHKEKSKFGSVDNESEEAEEQQQENEEAKTNEEFEGDEEELEFEFEDDITDDDNNDINDDDENEEENDADESDESFVTTDGDSQCNSSDEYEAGKSNSQHSEATEATEFEKDDLDLME